MYSIPKALLEKGANYAEARSCRPDTAFRIGWSITRRPDDILYKNSQDIVWCPLIAALSDPCFDWNYTVTEMLW